MQNARGFEYGVVHLISPRSGLVLQIVSSELNLDLDFVQILLDLGSIYHNHARILGNILVAEGDYLRVHTRPRRFPVCGLQWQEQIIFENADFIVVDKPAGIPVHASVDNTKENLLSYLKDFLKHDLFVTHRLDVPTKGLIVLAKTVKFQSEFNKLLIAREVQKFYRALVTGEGPELGMLTHYMEPSPRAPKKVSKDPFPGWQNCVLEVLEKNNLPESEKTELIIELHTGRTHQIRAQLAAEGFPILGDTAYGGVKHYEIEEIGLSACELRFRYRSENINFVI